MTVILEHLKLTQEYLRFNKRIPFHFVIAKNGDIQTGASINNISAHVAPEWQ